MSDSANRVGRYRSEPPPLRMLTTSDRSPFGSGNKTLEQILAKVVAASKEQAAVEHKAEED